jgi:hypothetical protein
MSLRRSLPAVVPLLAFLALPTVGHAASVADELSDLREALAFGKASGTIRYRFENVDQSGVAKDANASTLRGVLGYETKSYHGITTFAQFEGVWAVGEDNYRSGTNGKAAATYPLVADQPSVELQQAWAQYVCPLDSWKTAVRFGRQEINLSNQRLVGSVAWRQDQQSFDGVGISSMPYNAGATNLTFGYHYLNRVNRVFPDSSVTNPFQGNLDMSTHLAQATYKLDGYGQLVAYGLFLDYDGTVAAVTNNSSRTLGARASGAYKLNDTLSALYGAEYARQGDYGSNTNSYDAGYYQAEVGATWEDFTLKYGYSVLQGDSATDKFTTPLATGHAFNGWADVFLNTPNGGLKAHSLSLIYLPSVVKGLTLTGIGYVFKGESNSDHYGNELDLMADYKISQFPGLMVGVKFARFVGDKVNSMTGASVTGATAEDLTKTMVFTQYTF